MAVTLNQWVVTPSATTVAAGSVTFTVANDGTVPHEFVVLQTDTPAADFPIESFEGETERFNEDTAGEVVRAGANILVAGEAIFGSKDIGRAIARIRGKAPSR